MKLFRFYLNSIKKSNYTDYIDEDRILLVDDQEINLITIKSKIEKFLVGLKCDIARNGNDAIDIIKKNNYQLVLMDVQMSGMNGFITAKTIKNYNKNITIIALTSLSKKSFRKEMAKEFDKNYFDFYVSKSAPDNILFRGIAKWLYRFKDNFYYLGEKKDYIKNLQNKRVVLADDQAVSRIIIKKFLEDVGLEVVEAEDGSRLLEIYRHSLDDKGKTNIDIIITDINMPIINGDEVSTIIRKIENFNEINYHQELPIIALSGDGEKDDIKKYLDSQMTDYFIKGDDYELLIKIISNYLTKRYSIALDELPSDLKFFAEINNFLSIDDVKIFNESALLLFDKDEKTKLFSLFIKESAELINNIIKSNSNNNIKDVLFYIHSIKGISRSVGADRLFCNIRTIESLLKNNKILVDWLQVIIDSHQEFIKEVQIFLK